MTVAAATVGFLGAAGAMAASTVGNAATSARSVDGASRMTTILNEAFAAPGEQVTGFSFFAQRGGTLTPLLFARSEVDGRSVFTVTGTGAARTVGEGAFSFSFDLTAGTDIVGDNSYFGFSNEDLGVVTYQRGVPGAAAFITEFSHANTPGLDYGFDASRVSNSPMSGLSNRIYSVNAITAAVPEPASWAMMIAGLGLVGASTRKRARIAAA